MIFRWNNFKLCPLDWTVGRTCRKFKIIFFFVNFRTRNSLKPTVRILLTRSLPGYFCQKWVLLKTWFLEGSINLLCTPLLQSIAVQLRLLLCNLLEQMLVRSSRFEVKTRCVIGSSWEALRSVRSSIFTSAVWGEVLVTFLPG